MKLIAKLTAIAALAALTTTAAFASGPNWPSPAPNVTPRMIVAPAAAPKCDTMAIQGGGRSGMQVVSCKHNANVRPDDCRRACANK